MKKKLEVSELLQKIRIQLPLVFDQKAYRKALTKITTVHKVSAPTYKKLLKSPKQISLNWNEKTVKVLFTLSDDFEVIDLLSAWTQDKYYISHYSALYWNELVEQRSSEYCLSTEVKAHLRKSTSSINELLVKQVFMKEPRITANYVTYKNNRFRFIEKPNLNEVGVIKKKVIQDDHTLFIRVTDIERTLLDSIISPHYSGGLSVIFQSFRHAKINLENLYKYYEKYHLIYPYWQSIGFILEHSKGEDIASKWESYFDMEKINFYLDRNYRSDWVFSDRWKIFYPKVLVRDGN